MTFATHAIQVTLSLSAVWMFFALISQLRAIYEPFPRARREMLTVAGKAFLGSLAWAGAAGLIYGLQFIWNW